jgi:hypothetical protein
MTTPATHVEVEAAATAATYTFIPTSTSWLTEDRVSMMVRPCMKQHNYGRATQLRLIVAVEQHERDSRGDFGDFLPDGARTGGVFVPETRDTKSFGSTVVSVTRVCTAIRVCFSVLLRPHLFPHPLFWLNSPCMHGG